MPLQQAPPPDEPPRKPKVQAKKSPTAALKARPTCAACREVDCGPACGDPCHGDPYMGDWPIGPPPGFEFTPPEGWKPNSDLPSFQGGR